MMVNDGLKEFSQKEKFCYCLIATIELESVQRHKLPTDIEAEVLNYIEDIFLTELSECTNPILVGRETYFGEREILIHFPYLDKFKQKIDLLSKKVNAMRCTHIELHHDPEWKNAKRYFG